MHKIPQSPCKGLKGFLSWSREKTWAGGAEDAAWRWQYCTSFIWVMLWQAELREVPHGMRGCIVEVQRLYIRGLHLETEEGKGTRGEWSQGGAGV